MFWRWMAESGVSRGISTSRRSSLIATEAARWIRFCIAPDASVPTVAASVALKERRKLVLVPRETPLSSIHLRGLATLNEAGAVILFAAPGFYHGAETVADLVDFVVARCLDQIGIDNALVTRWGEGR